ncbi:OLC1v1004389C1 [Oldenlandia corymbosa var. corymbosa]|uniref:OLC1v1004389C1 n=1 Tax=Oldenlandia corymbosa var. corymbosa TaxID=529605 RepID=A0AAV1DC81_OLDCO|nr:OLC1v1004389C1 [Oldenlandia corymbosa var. corymbosa]
MKEKFFRGEKIRKKKDEEEEEEGEEENGCFRCEGELPPGKYQPIAHIRLYSRLICKIKGVCVLEDLQESLKILKGVIMNDIKLYYDYGPQVVDRSTGKEIREVIWKAEDAIDSYLVVAATAPLRMGHFHFHKKFYFLAKQIRYFGGRVENEVKRRPLEAHQIEAHQPAGTSSSEEAHTIEERHVVGFDKAAQGLKELLSEGPEHLEIMT